LMRWTRQSEAEIQDTMCFRSDIRNTSVPTPDCPSCIAVNTLWRYLTIGAVMQTSYPVFEGIFVPNADDQLHFPLNRTCFYYILNPQVMRFHSST
jgi:hypothetical protein